MTAPAKDPLLTTAKVVLKIVAVGIAIALAVSCFGFVALFADANGIFTERFAGAPPEATWWTIGLAVLSTALLVMSLLFVFDLIRIVGSVGEGDPFRPVNADRLRRMAWLVLGVQICTLLLAPLTFMLLDYLPEVAGRANHGGLGGFVLALVLFLLARVFRHGTVIRDDLEGTV